MKHTQNRPARIKIVAGVLLLVVVALVGFFIFRQQSRPLSAAQINKKFDCNRITADYKETDVFCGNPKFYNDPRSVTRDDFYKYYACDNRLKRGPPAEDAKTSDPGYYNAYYNCKDEAKLESLRQDFITTLEKLKAEE